MLPASANEESKTAQNGFQRFSGIEESKGPPRRPTQIRAPLYPEDNHNRVRNLFLPEDNQDLHRRLRAALNENS